MTVKFPIYLDHQATTPLDPAVLEVMMPYLTDKFGNPHSAAHRFGWEANAAVDVAREQVAAIIGAGADEIIFTSGATEANNLAIKGVAEAYTQHKRHLVTVVTEHKCVLESMRTMEGRGFTVTYLPVDADGLVSADDVKAALTSNTALISIMAVNNEIGTIAPLAEIGAMARSAGVKFHVDAAQAVGKIPLSVDEMNIDLMSISGHKMYGPKGVGALYIRKRPRVVVAPQMHGGGQERGLRSGTLAPALIAGFGKAAEIAQANMATETPRIEALAQSFWHRLARELNGVALNGGTGKRFWGNLNISLDGVDADRLMAAMRDVAVSSAAACASGSNEPSYVLQAIGVPELRAKASLRFGFGRFTTGEESDAAADKVIAAVRQSRKAA